MGTGGAVFLKKKYNDYNRLDRNLMAGWTGLEPVTSGVTGQRCNQLYYHPALMNLCQRILVIAIEFLSVLKKFYRTRK